MESKKEQTKQKRVTGTENKDGVVGGNGGRRRNETGKVNHRYILPVPKQMSHRDEMYSMGNAVKNNAASLYGDRW